MFSSQSNMLLVLLSATVMTAIGVVYQEDALIAANEREGQEVIRQIEALLATGSSSERQTFNTALSMKSRPSTSGQSGNAGPSGNAGRPGRPSPSFRGCSPFSGKECCKVTIPPLIVRRTRQVYNHRLCTRYPHRDFELHNRAKRRAIGFFDDCYRTEVYYQSVPQTCPATHHTCCLGKIWYKFGCIEIAELRRWLAYLRNGGVGYPPCAIPTSTTTTRRPSIFINPCFRRPYDRNGRRQYCP